MAGQIIKRGNKTWVVRIFTGRDDAGNHEGDRERCRYGTQAHGVRHLGVGGEPRFPEDIAVAVAMRGSFVRASRR